jgi:hypothetical protein
LSSLGDVLSALAHPVVPNIGRTVLFTQLLTSYGRRWTFHYTTLFTHI